MVIFFTLHGKLAENFWNTFERLRATWISVEPRITRDTLTTRQRFQKLVVKMLRTNFSTLLGLHTYIRLDLIVVAA